MLQLITGRWCVAEHHRRCLELNIIDRKTLPEVNGYSPRVGFYFTNEEKNEL